MFQQIRTLGFLAYVRSIFGLALVSQVKEARTEGINLVRNNPGQFGLTTVASVIKEVADAPGKHGLWLREDVLTEIAVAPAFFGYLRIDDVLAIDPAFANNVENASRIARRERTIAAAQGNRAAEISEKAAGHKALADRRQNGVDAFRTASR